MSTSGLHIPFVIIAVGLLVVPFFPHWGLIAIIAGILQLALLAVAAPLLFIWYIIFPAVEE